ncbi:MAG TPA: hypothetical protein DEA90_03980 [Opitutae bacterium]|nr:hypothetical protein [Puniceicoccaceae bacterium]HBR93304.1 hypothetical protein [Opitutae bacterium]
MVGLIYSKPPLRDQRVGAFYYKNRNYPRGWKSLVKDALKIILQLEGRVLVFELSVCVFIG